MRRILFLVSILLAACGVQEMETAVPQANTIICTAAYRSSVEVGIEREETLTFVDASDEQSVAFDDMAFHAAYSPGEADNERALRVWVTDGGGTAVWQSTLYQLPPNSGPQNQFVGGHGFTGLNYSYAPGSSAELQFWCAAA